MNDEIIKRRRLESFEELPTPETEDGWLSLIDEMCEEVVIGKRTGNEVHLSSRTFPGGDPDIDPEPYCKTDSGIDYVEVPTGPHTRGRKTLCDHCQTAIEYVVENGKKPPTRRPGPIGGYGLDDHLELVKRSGGSIDV